MGFRDKDDYLKAESLTVAQSGDRKICKVKEDEEVDEGQEGNEKPLIRLVMREEGGKGKKAVKLYRNGLLDSYTWTLRQGDSSSRTVWETHTTMVASFYSALIHFSTVYFLLQGRCCCFGIRLIEDSCSITATIFCPVVGNLAN